MGLVTTLYLAGTDTTSKGIYWTFLYMVVYPEIQEKIYTEIQQNIGKRTTHKVQACPHHTVSYALFVVITPNKCRRNSWKPEQLVNEECYFSALQWP